MSAMTIANAKTEIPDNSEALTIIRRGKPARSVQVSAGEYMVIRRSSENADEARNLAKRILKEAEARTTGTDSRKFLSNVRNRRV
ncbi:hypothetical protein [Undibacterium sp.]|jgi:hypothetical protein|uniref:hypothetical protein n=1 Tax=Undibacterium sp. TaxID=1914977 RepID=UPI002CF64319|nr:hypothetical protein [Undibacterium sp.]HTD06242.1 hypothetical protein [Undibacterium sp.]